MVLFLWVFCMFLVCTKNVNFTCMPTWLSDVNCTSDRR
jgi:hypothetical protein